MNSRLSNRKSEYDRLTIDLMRATYHAGHHQGGEIQLVVALSVYGGRHVGDTLKQLMDIDLWELLCSGENHDIVRWIIDEIIEGPIG